MFILKYSSGDVGANVGLRLPEYSAALQCGDLAWLVSDLQEDKHDGVDVNIKKSLKKEPGLIEQSIQMRR